MLGNGGQTTQRRVTGMRNGHPRCGQEIEIRCRNSVDGCTATPTNLPFELQAKLGQEMIREARGVVSVTYNSVRKASLTIEAVQTTSSSPGKVSTSPADRAAVDFLSPVW
jgi:GMP synthase PP-ATPase subunit